MTIETATNDITFSKYHRRVAHRDEPATRELAPLKKSIYSLVDLREILPGSLKIQSGHKGYEDTID